MLGKWALSHCVTVPSEVADVALSTELNSEITFTITASMSPSDSLTYDYLASEEVEAALAIEQEGYPSDEAGSLESFRFRHSRAGSLFLGAYLPRSDGSRELIGYICSTLSPEKTLTHHSMSHHVPKSSSICIHSVCVAKSHERRGVGLNLLKEYIGRVQSDKSYERILLITHDNLRQFYEKAGFEWVGLSAVVHGSKPWYEMRLLLQPSAPRISPEGLQALLQPSSQKRFPELLSDFKAARDIVEEEDSKPGTSVNKYDLLCPRGCRSIILKSKCAEFVERTSVMMEPEDAVPNPLLPSIPPPPETTTWWLVKGSAMSFENIGFTRPVGTLSTGKRTKLLICAECDLGPLGWCEEGGSEFWLAVSRVGYKV